MQRTGLYPSKNAGAVVDAPGETWAGISMALRSGIRGLPGGSSLFQLLVAHGRLIELNNRPGGHVPASVSESDLDKLRAAYLELMGAYGVAPADALNFPPFARGVWGE